jgi:hypothetical protein
MKKTNERPRFVHLGERLAAMERIRAGDVTPAEAAAELRVDAAQVARWFEQHANDRLVGLDELRAPRDRRNARLAERARRLAALLARAERRVHELHLELLSKEFGEKSHRDLASVSRAQPRGD